MSSVWLQKVQVAATESVDPAALEADIGHALATEKLDGTCCYVTVYKGFIWNVEEDFKMVPETWIPAHRVQHHDGHPVPEEHGHIPVPMCSGPQNVEATPEESQICQHHEDKREHSTGETQSWVGSLQCEPRAQVS
uniref:RNA ligase 1 n=1 Tax=Monopterus albus TaxID=43700 RepID=A0A3Q3JQ00_MONAL